MLCGEFAAVEDALDKYRAYGIRLQLYFQSAGQLKKCFADDQGQTLQSNSAQVYFATNDYATAEAISARLGAATIVVKSGGTGGGGSRTQSHSGQTQTSGSTSWNWSDNWQQQARRLLLPEEVLALEPRTAITFVPGIPPICTTLLRYYEEKDARTSGPIRRAAIASLTFVASAVMCATLAVAAAGLTRVAVDRVAASDVAMPNLKAFRSR